MRLSSNISGFYKYFVPILMLAFVILPIVIIIILYATEGISIIEIVGLIFMSLVFFLVIYPHIRILVRLVDVSYSNDLFIIKSRNIGIKKIESSKISNIERTLYSFYKIVVIENNIQTNYYFIPKIFEVFDNPWGEPKSIKTIKKKIKISHIETSAGFFKVMKDYFIDIANSIVLIFKKKKNE